MDTIVFYVDLKTVSATIRVEILIHNTTQQDLNCS